MAGRQTAGSSDRAWGRSARFHGHGGWCCYYERPVHRYSHALQATSCYHFSAAVMHDAASHSSSVLHMGVV